MPRRVIDRDEDLHIDLRLGPKRDERRRWVDRRLQQRHLPKPLHHLGARGVWVPKPPANSQWAIVKLWTAKAATTGGHLRYLSRAMGLDGTDAVLFDRDGPVDRQAFVLRARPDGYQLRGMVSLDAEDRADWRRFLPRLMAPFEADVGSRVDWLRAVHHDAARVHAHVVIRGVLPDGQRRYLTKHSWAYGFTYWAQMLATAMLGPTPGGPGRAVQAVRQWLQPTDPGAGADAMSQRRFGNDEFAVVTGWDRPLQYLFLEIYHRDRDTPILSNLYRHDPAMTLQDIEATLTAYGVAAPPTLLRDLANDQAQNRGNHEVWYDDTGIHEVPAFGRSAARAGEGAAMVTRIRELADRVRDWFSRSQDQDRGMEL
jgi:hypothetical protein